LEEYRARVFAERAIAKLERGDLAGAIDVVEQGLSLSPEDEELLRLRDEILGYYSAGSRESAAVEQAPSVPDKGEAPLLLREPHDDRTQRLRRHPTLEAPRSVEREQVFSVLFQLTEKKRAEGHRIDPGLESAVTADGKLEVRLPDERPSPDEPLEWTLDVILSAPGFDVESPSTTEIRVRPEADSGVAAFKLRQKPLEDRPRPDDRSLQVTLWHRGTFLARVSRSVVVHFPEPAHFSEPAPARGEQPAADAARARVDVRAEVPLDLALVPPDLTLYVQHHPDPGIGGYAEILVHTQHLSPRGPRRLTMPGDLRDWLTDQYSRFAELGRGTSLIGPAHGGATSPDDRKALRIALLEGFGETLYRRFATSESKQALWALKEKLGGRFDSVQIFTDDPVLPWELMRPYRGSEQAGFLGVGFRVGRWHIGTDGRQLSCLTSLTLARPRRARAKNPRTAGSAESTSSTNKRQDKLGPWLIPARAYSGRLGAGASVPLLCARQATLVAAT
jgi:hypothetical protein